MAISIAHRLVGVVDDAALFVGFHDLSFHHPFQRGLAVDDVVIGLTGHVLERDVVIVDEGREVLFLALAAPLPFVGVLDALEGFGVDLGLWDKVVGALLERDHIRLNAFEVHMYIAQRAACIAEGGEVFEHPDRRDAGELLGKVILAALAVVGRMQKAVNVIEQVLFPRASRHCNCHRYGELQCSDGFRRQ